MDPKAMEKVSRNPFKGDTKLEKSESCLDKIIEPDLRNCHVPIDAPRCAPNHCKPPFVDEKPTEYVFPPSTGKPRLRRAAHSEYFTEGGVARNPRVADYAKAVLLMKELPPDDPRNFMQQANVHFAYCSGAYDVLGADNPQKLFEVHGNWLFLPWHRWYLYFYERILAKLLGDETFALPFWNWDNEPGMRIPEMYSRIPGLFNGFRTPNSEGLVDFSFGDSITPADQIVTRNYSIMHKHVKTQTTEEAFLGKPFQPFCPGCSSGPGSFEISPHNPVRLWTGTLQQATDSNVRDHAQEMRETDTPPVGEDMGLQYSAARDPIFFAHHANVDRIWDIWRSKLHGNDKNYEKHLRNTKFYFCDENARLVSVSASDAFQIEKLGYNYDWEPIKQWTHIGPPPTPSRLTREHKEGLVEGNPQGNNIISNWHHRHRSKDIVHFKVKRELLPSDSNRKYVLVIEGIRVPKSIAVKFDVFVELATENPEYVNGVPYEYVGTFVQLAGGSGDRMCGQSSMDIVISDALKNNEDDLIKVTIIPKVTLPHEIEIAAVKIKHV